jgi:hypothetical protein
LCARRFGLGLDGVAAVGEKRRSAARKDQQAIASGEAAKVTDVRQVGNDNGFSVEL